VRCRPRPWRSGPGKRDGLVPLAVDCKLITTLMLQCNRFGAVAPKAPCARQRAQLPTIGFRGRESASAQNRRQSSRRSSTGSRAATSRSVAVVECDPRLSKAHLRARRRCPSHAPVARCQLASLRGRSSSRSVA
jgi:hypothetical protein